MWYFTIQVLLLSFLKSVYKKKCSGKFIRSHDFCPKLLTDFTFIGPCIFVYFCSKTNQMHQCTKLFYFGMTLYMFQTVLPSIIRNSRLYIQQPNRYCCLLASKRTAVSVWHTPVAVCTVLNSWWWTARPSETCWVSFQNKIIWYTGASGWFYYRNYLQDFDYI